MNYFNIIDFAGELYVCENIIKCLFRKLSDKQKYCIILVYEIHMELAIHYQGNIVIDYSRDEPSKPGRIFLATMTAPMMGGPAFV